MEVGIMKDIIIYMEGILSNRRKNLTEYENRFFGLLFLFFFFLRFFLNFVIFNEERFLVSNIIFEL